MGIFTKDKRSKVPAFLLSDEGDQSEPTSEVSYNSVLDYLVGLSDDDHDKIFKVSGIYRKANKQAAEVLGVEDEPVNTIGDQPEATTAAPADDDDINDDELDAMLNSVTDEPAFIEDEPKTKRSK